MYFGMDFENLSVAELLNKRWDLAISMKTAYGTFREIAFQCYKEEFKVSKVKDLEIEKHVQKRWEKTDDNQREQYLELTKQNNMAITQEMKRIDAAVIGKREGERKYGGAPPTKLTTAENIETDIEFLYNPIVWFMFLDTLDESKTKEDFKWPDDIHALKLKAIKKWAFLRESERRSFVNRALDVYNIHTGFDDEQEVLNLLNQTLSEEIETGKEDGFCMEEDSE